MQTPNLGRALGRYSHVRMVPAPDWLPQRRAPRSTSGRAKASGLIYERQTVAAIHQSFTQMSIDSPKFDFTEKLRKTGSDRQKTPPSRCVIGSSGRDTITKDTISIGPPELIPGQWLEYQKPNSNIKHFCQPDLLIIFWPLPTPVVSIDTPANHPVVSISTNHPRTNHLLITNDKGSGKVSTKNQTGQPAPGSISSQHNNNPILIIVCEIKLTYTPTAIKKLNRLYLPLIDSIFHPSILLPLVICKNLTGASPPHTLTLSNSLSLPIPLITYLPNYNFRII